MNNDRLLYPDICKFIAIFVVTWSHCAQRISGTIFSNIFGGWQFDLVFTMPLLMIMSGWFINLDKMRNAPLAEFAFLKFKRLIIPSFVWYFVLLILSSSWIDLSFFTYYWYLNALFVCLCVIMLFSKIIKNNLSCCIVTTLVVLLIPYSDYSHINFMMPFLWAGYGLRKIITRKHVHLVIIMCSIIGISLCLTWNPDYSVYSSPFNLLYMSQKVVLIMIYRFILGFTLSTVFIFLIMKLEKTWLAKMSQFGSYTLVIYTSSLACLGFFSRVLDYFDIHTNRYGLIDVLSLFLCIFLIFLAIKIADFCRKVMIIRHLFLGE